MEFTSVTGALCCRPDGGAECVQVHRLLEKVRGADLHPVDAGGDGAVAGQDDDRDVETGALDLAQGRQAVDAGKVQSRAETQAKILEERLARQCGVADVLLKSGCGIKAGAMVLKGVTIGANSVVAAGAVVTHDVDSLSVVAGIPAKVIERIG